MSLIKTLNTAKAEGMTPDEIVLVVSNPLTRAMTREQIENSGFTVFKVAWIISSTSLDLQNFRDDCEPIKYDEEHHICYFNTPGKGVMGLYQNAPEWSLEEIERECVSGSDMLFIPME